MVVVVFVQIVIQNLCKEEEEEERREKKTTRGKYKQQKWMIA